jgi:hypothetical protein
MNKKLLTLLLLATITLTTNAQNWFSSKVKGNGNIITEKRTTSNYNGIRSSGSFHVLLVNGKEGEITLKGEENILPLIETIIENNTLKIRFQKNTNVRTTKKVIITVPVTDIETITLAGSGNIESKNVLKGENIITKLSGSGSINLVANTEEINAEITGSGNINLEGTAVLFNTKITGSGDVKAYELQAEEVQIKITGSGSVKANVSKRIAAKITGSGNVYYQGNPKYVNSKTTGSGSIIKRE